MLTQSDGRNCVYSPLHSDPEFYNLPVEITHEYKLRIVCEGYITELNIYAYNEGQLDVAILSLTSNSMLSPITQMTEYIRLHQGKYMTLYFKEPYALVNTNMTVVLRIYEHKIYLPIIRERKLDILNHGSVVGRPEIFLTQNYINESARIKTYKHLRIPSVEVKVDPIGSSTLEAEDTSMSEYEMTTTEMTTSTSTSYMTTDVITKSSSTRCSINMMKKYLLLCFLVLFNRI